MFILIYVGVSLATDPFVIRDSLVEGLRYFAEDSTPEKAYFVDRVEDMLIEMAFCSSDAQDIIIMEGFASFAKHVILLDDIEERTVNRISKIIAEHGIMNRKESWIPERLPPIDLLIRCGYDILTQTNMDMFELTPSDTIPNQNVIHRILKNIASSIFPYPLTAYRALPVERMGRMTGTQLLRIENLSIQLKQDCLRFMLSNPDRFIICLPMHSLLRLDVSGMAVEDLLIGEELEYVQASIWDLIRPRMELHEKLREIFLGMLDIYELVVEKRRINRREVSRILKEAPKRAANYKKVWDFFEYAIFEPLRRVERSQEPDATLQAFVQPALELSPVDISDMILDAVLLRFDTSCDHHSQKKALISDWRLKASSYDKLRMSYWVSSSGVLDSLNRGKGVEELPSEFNIMMEDSQFHRLLAKSDPRIVSYGMSLRDADFSDEMWETLNRLRRLSLKHKSLEPLFHEFCHSSSIDLNHSLRRAIISYFEHFESRSEVGSILDTALGFNIASLTRKFLMGVKWETRNPVEATFMFWNQLTPVQFEHRYRDFRKALVDLLDVSSRLHAILEIGEKGPNQLAIIKSFHHKIRDIISNRIHIPGSFQITGNHDLSHMYRNMFPWGSMDSWAPSPWLAKQWNQKLDKMIG
jgi:hypothetical protein